MTDPMMNLKSLLEKAPDADLLREMIGFAAERLMELEVGAMTGAGCGEKSAERLTQRNGYAESGSITEALRIEGIADYRRHETRLTAERLLPADAEHLAAAPDGIALVAFAVNVDLADRPFQVRRTRFHAERMELVFRH